MPIAPGARLGPYEVIAPVGAGGMGEVFKARDTRLERQVAIKVLPAEFANNAQLRMRFEREAKAISQLSHPNICTLYDVGDGYLVMELLDGETLADRLSRGPLPVDQVLKIGAQIADALDRAHKAGIVHRDLKPSNVMLTKTGAKLLDFGLAKGGTQAISTVGETVHKPLTEEGTVVGTYHYMAPEQLAGEQADARTDIFAFGALLYEMVTGRRAFDGKTKTSIITSIVSREPAPISQIQPFTPPALEHLVRKCLSKDPDDRWQSAHDIASQLRWIIDSGSAAGVAAPMLRTRRSRERLLWIAAAAVVAAGAFFLATRLHLGERPRQIRFTIPMIDAGYTNGNQVRISPDGETLFFRATKDGQRFQIYRRRLGEPTAQPIDGTEDAFTYTISGDGRSLLLAYSGAVLKRVSVNGGPTELLVEGQQGAGAIATASADGVMLFGGDDRPVSRMLPDQKLEAITTVDTAHGETGHASPYFLPDGRSFLFLSVNRDAQRGTMRRVLCGARLGSNEITRIGEITSRVEYAMGHLFFVRGGTLMAQPFDVSQFKFTGEAVPVVENVVFNSRLGSGGFSVASNGTIVYQPYSPSGRMSVVDAAGKVLTTVEPPGLSGNRFGIFPDGSRAVVMMMDRRAGISSLWIYELARQTATRLTFSPANEFWPVISPDGSRVYFSSDAQSPWDIYEAPVDGSEPPKLLVAAPNNQSPNDVSFDGKYLLYTSNETANTTRQDLYVLALSEGGKPRPFLKTPAIENEGAFSPDGKWVAYSSEVTGTYQIFVRPFPGPGSARQVSTRGGRSSRFGRDGKHLYFVDRTKLMVVDFRADGSTSEPVAVFDAHANIAAFQPMSGDRFMVASQSESDASPPAGVIVGWHP